MTGCSCTQSSSYWSATTIAGTPGGAWSVDDSNGFVFNFTKTFNLYVRAVRDGL